ncbi:MAG: signal peptidase II [Propionibacteriaceae bacterium]|nr:signal peptidase II [Propionibacteriaceae bacterium]
MRDLQAAGGTALSTAAASRPARVLGGRAAWALALGIGALGYAIDQATKALALAYLDPQNPPVLLGGLLRLQLIFNPGAAFSMGADFTVVLTLVSVAALVLVVAWVLPRARHVGWVIAFGLLLAGILGNLTDRLVRPPAPLHGHVIDFFQLPNFAIFNVADMCITFAAVTIVWLVMITQVDLSGASTKEARPKASGGGA